MPEPVITVIFYAVFALGFWAALRLVPGKVGRVGFFLGVHAVTLTGWYIIAETEATVATAGLATGTGLAVALLTGVLTGGLAVAFSRWLNRQEGFAWLALLPFALPVMALMPARQAAA